MRVKDLIAELEKFDKELEIGGVVVSYTEHGSNCGEYEYGCYCSAEDHTFDSVSLVKEEKLRKSKNDPTVVKRIWIRGD